MSGLGAPTVMQFASDGSIVVADLGGQIYSYRSLSDTSPVLVADLSPEVNSYGDRGLLGMALAPNYPTDNHIYVLYAMDAPIGGTPPTWNDTCPAAKTDGCTIGARLSRLTISDGVSVNEQVLVEDWCQQFSSHSIGSLTFGKDGYLYATGGDGSSYSQVDYGQLGGQLAGDTANPCGDAPGGVGVALTPPTAEGGALRSQSILFDDNRTWLNGTVIRIDPSTGEGAPGNPFAGDGNANRRRIIAWGLRNPFRVTTRPGTNELWIGDVSANGADEIDQMPDTTNGLAMNFGWPCYEGDAIQPNFQALGLNGCQSLYDIPNSTSPPYFSYGHAQTPAANDTCPIGSTSISGLAFYSGSNYPSQYKNALFFADHARNCLWAMLPTLHGDPDPDNIVSLGHVNHPVDLVAGPASLNNDLFYVDLDEGQIHRISYTPANQPPVAVANVTPTIGQTPLLVNFDGTGSTDPEGEQLSYSWDFGDGTTSTTATGTHTYSKAGTYTATLTVSDPEGLTNSASVTVLAGAAIKEMTVQVRGPAGAARTTYRVGDSINFTASAVDPSGAAIPATNYSWQLTIHQCSSATNCVTTNGGTVTGVQTGKFAVPDAAYPSYLTVDLTVSVPGSSQTMSKSISVNPQTVALTFAASPSTPKLNLSVDASTGLAPFTQTFVVNHVLTVSAPLQQTVSGHVYTWVKWSDGKPATHTIVAPAIGKTFTATYKRIS